MSPKRPREAANLFAAAGMEADAPRPLPDKLRPRTLSDVVGQDETEGGLRAILNFGHTIGHALESATSYRRYKHGEAIAIGMMAACAIGEEADEFLRGGVHDFPPHSPYPVRADAQPGL